MLNIGLIGATGHMGSCFCPPLVHASREGRLRLVILHRPGSDDTKYPVGVERRVLDLENMKPLEIEQAIQGLQVVM